MKTYEEIVQAYRDAYKRYALNDEYLRENDCKARDSLPIAAEWSYGVVYLQDDAVDVLLTRIAELEKMLEEARE